MIHHGISRSFMYTNTVLLLPLSVLHFVVIGWFGSRLRTLVH